jgi:hypothetical protein
MDPPELWSALNVIKDLDTFTINLQEPPNFGWKVTVLVIFWDTREGKGTPWDPWAINASKEEGISRNRLVTTTPRRSVRELPWKH